MFKISARGGGLRVIPLIGLRDLPPDRRRAEIEGAFEDGTLIEWPGLDELDWAIEDIRGIFSMFGIEEESSNMIFASNRYGRWRVSVRGSYSYVRGLKRKVAREFSGNSDLISIASGMTAAQKALGYSIGANLADGRDRSIVEGYAYSERLWGGDHQAIDKLEGHIKDLLDYAGDMLDRDEEYYNSDEYLESSIIEAENPSYDPETFERDHGDRVYLAAFGPIGGESIRFFISKEMAISYLAREILWRGKFYTGYRRGGKFSRGDLERIARHGVESPAGSLFYMGFQARVMEASEDGGEMRAIISFGSRHGGIQGILSIQADTPWLKTAA